MVTTAGPRRRRASGVLVETLITGVTAFPVGVLGSR
jgi:hypothetical protein